ncbi:MAG: cob(I)yrinic acid a,c-diamide adenosyltransferase [Bdellovibrionaceae bacterium]|nr:cob(I)yrinic acid a,c-diamide adenosyltransferase [Bdellovibrionales bacterium]MCB9082913.1 cob(I)yrinic acid a,c-diamide adenosyltransferase [Pseudobdellovibrionaceae bacterium]
MSTKIYTRGGDQGTTSLVNGKRVTKSHLRLDAYGTVDELNSVLGIVGSQLSTLIGQSNMMDFAKASLDEVRILQNQLFIIGSHLACDDDKWTKKLPPLSEGLVSRLEGQIDSWTEQLKPLTEFILPGGCLIASFLHQARTICRRAERYAIGLNEDGESVDPIIIMYLNRLSDYLFVMARFANQKMGETDIMWKK